MANFEKIDKFIEKYGEDEILSQLNSQRALVDNDYASHSVETNQKNYSFADDLYEAFMEFFADNEE